MVPDLLKLLDRLDNTGCIVTTVLEGRYAACFASFVTACSNNPPRFLVCTSHENQTHEFLNTSSVLAIHPVARDQESWIHQFGEVSGRDVDKFAGVNWRPGHTGVPLLTEGLGYIEGRVIASLECGDHTVRLVDPVAAELWREDEAPLNMFEIIGRSLDKTRPTSLEWARRAMRIP